MRRIALIAALLVTAAGAFVTSAGADDVKTYEIEMYNAFGLVTGSNVRVAGVNAGEVTALDITPDKTALATVEMSGPLSTLGEDTKCSSEPQSLIAEYFIDCTPEGPELEEDDDLDPDIPASQVTQTVQTDLVQNTLREPFKRRFQLLINEFGTALAGNAEQLNEAIRLGAPALRDLEQVLRIMADQNTIIRDLNVDSDRIMSRLADNREDVVAFIKNAEATAAASAERRADLSRNFEILDDFLFELEPTLADLEVLAREQTPLLTDLQAAAPGLNEFAINLCDSAVQAGERVCVGAGEDADQPGFNTASEISLESLGDASLAGRTALRKDEDEIDQLADTAKNAPAAGEALADFLRDLDDPGRAVETDQRAARDTNRKAPTGYTGLEGLLNYVYYQTGAINQFDEIGHQLHFTLFAVDAAGQNEHCGEAFTGRDHETGEQEAAEEGGGTTHNTSITNPKLDPCVSWLGPSQPGLNSINPIPGGLGQYDPSVCPHGTEPQAAEDELCDSNPNTTAGEAGGTGPSEADLKQATTPSGGASIGDPGSLLPDPLPGAPDVPGGGGLPDIGGQPDAGDVKDLPRRVRQRLRDRLNRGAGTGGGGGGGGQATEDILDFLLKP